MIIKNNKISVKVTLLLFLFFFLIGIITFKDYGISVDEEYHRFAGFYWLNYILSFTPFDELKNIVAFKLGAIKGFTLPLPKDHPANGAIFDLYSAFLETIFKINDPKNIFYFKHLLNFIFFFIGSIFFYKLLLNRFSDYKISLIGTLFFVLSPRIYGHGFFNMKDIIFLSLAIITIYYCFKYWDKSNYKNLLIFSILAALSTSHRILGIFLPASFVIFYLLSVLSNKKDLNYLSHIIFFLIFYFLFVIVFWPYLWSNPIENFVLSFEYFWDHHLKIEMLFSGKYVYTNFLPYKYIFVWILITTPILYMIFFIIGYIQIFKRFFLKFVNIKDNVHYYDLWRSVNEKKDLFILFCITSVILYFVFFNIILYNGWRQIYFLNIFIIYIATYAFYRTNIYLKLKHKNKFLYNIVALFLLFVVYKMIIYHPYQNIYFNSFLNKQNIHQKFEVDYWGLSGKRFLEEILILENDKNTIRVAVASFLPLERSLKLLDQKDRKKIIIVGQDFQSADYLYSNFTSEVDKYSNDKYKVPSNFIKIDEFVVDNITVYEVFKKKIIKIK